MKQTILQIENLSVNYRIRHGIGHRKIVALKPTSCEIHRGEILAVVGESGSGKSTLGKAMLRLVEPSGGRIMYKQQNLMELSERQMRRLRPRFQMIFQDPYTSLNPSRPVGKILTDALSRRGGSRLQRDDCAMGLLAEVGLESDAANRLPKAFSGGQRQRIAIARALATSPDLIIADEPTSALDVSIQAQIVNLLASLKRSRGLTLVFISHDLEVVVNIADRVAVLYFGEIVELATAESLSVAPVHPYTEMLFECRLKPNLNSARSVISAVSQTPIADLPSQMNPPSGCPFRSRCLRAVEICGSVSPQLKQMANGTLVACHNPLPVPPNTIKQRK